MDWKGKNDRHVVVESGVGDGRQKISGEMTVWSESCGMNRLDVKPGEWNT